MSGCIGCGGAVECDIERYSILGYETKDPVCIQCLTAAFPRLAAILAEEAELQRASDERSESQRQLTRQLRDAPNRAEYKRILKTC